MTWEHQKLEQQVHGNQLQQQQMDQQQKHLQATLIEKKRRNSIDIVADVVSFSTSVCFLKFLNWS